MRKFLFLLLLVTSTHAADCLGELSIFAKPVVEYVQMAERFKVYEFGEYTLVVTKGPNGEEEQHLLSKKMEKILSLCPGTKKFKVPLERFVLTSTTHLPPFEMLGEAKRIVAVTNAKLVSSESIKKRIDDGEIEDTGYPLNPELILSYKPQILVTYSVESKELEGISKLESLGLPVVANYDFLEDHPLKRAEWIKFFALFLDKQDEAMREYNKIQSNYQGLVQKVLRKKKKPLVIVGKGSGEIWQASGGRSDFAKMLKDAGGKYIWSDDRSKTMISKRTEEVYTKVAKVDFWFPQNEWKGVRQILNEDSRFKNFLLVKNCFVFNNNRVVNKDGGNDYWETAMMRPDLLLMDLIAIMHPALLPYHKIRWYRELK